MNFRIFHIKFKKYSHSKILITENDEVIYRVFISGIFSKTYNFYDKFGVMKMQITKAFSWKSQPFIVFVNQKKVCAFTPKKFRNELQVESRYGHYYFNTDSFWKTSFTICNSTTEIGKLSRKHKLLKDEFGLALVENEHVQFLLAMTIYLIKRKKEQEAAASGG